MTPACTLRRASATDLPFVYDGELDYIRAIEPQQETRWRDGMRHHLKQWTADLPRMFVAERDGQVVGYCFWESHGEAAVLASIYVDPAERGKGLGRQLLDQYVADAREAGLVTLRLGVKPDNPARHLYEAAGFTPTHEDHGYRHYVLTTPDRAMPPSGR